MAAALPFVAMAATAGGQIFQGIEQKNAYYAGAKVDEENARLTQLGGEQDAWQARLDERRKTGDLLASQAGSGIAMGAASAADLIRENAYQRESEIYGIRSRASAQAIDLQRQAQEKRKAGRGALVGSIFNAVSSALNSASGMRNQNALIAQGRAERERTGGTGSTKTGTMQRKIPAMRVRGGG